MPTTTSPTTVLGSSGNLYRTSSTMYAAASPSRIHCSGYGSGWQLRAAPEVVLSQACCARCHLFRAKTKDVKSVHIVVRGPSCYSAL
uniref:Uncharacterized protein n=1 Tax=Hyaloperonospora arabidopsidis (strain Emoy2) TaxID=559515 RepID=M4BK25_HYAAE